MTRLVLATHNAGKVTELRQILVDAGVEAELLGMDSFPEVADVVETGVTFAANALLKAHAVAQATQLPAIADDSGLAVDVLGGAPGVFSARWSGRHGDDLANLQLLLAQLGDVPDEHRRAHFACAAALALPDGTEQVWHGTMPGHLIREPRGAGGFGYDPIFVPDEPEGNTLSSAQITPEQKNAISHRGHAFRSLAADLSKLLNT
ncbi:RdgB/HAM1 family non-canonical purine NTP pyrophosphatase [Kineosporia sp. NBRC 101731]|uniref:RdgB/HAM1 family non-canonical purine NTP pyrophosphatase n=1 Tax=Kineosporia sp. NBRC 101731 TaxID=3032199 RepID=UPI0024A009FF|nr:RdgB/HAM1 family non-canonical purine NTP pyrophosphatase [Kineosporia sp. NBRC 101731]GLY28295.1 non-canonical purine NTP pyrophosphatase [Kineosporia sp. NBRC 101731]